MFALLPSYPNSFPSQEFGDFKVLKLWMLLVGIYGFEIRILITRLLPYAVGTTGGQTSREGVRQAKNTRTFFMFHSGMRKE
ncbi:hypothetical protein TIFTF001_012066 [Ficus carica]|uniref:Uncharacterized protein n=1 Tax=Ficus carica TaxID=3494 RepID=A0AA88A120_FICCA|nr:hypothetical protein TIFTF001_012066 [Ficus carica]